MEFEARCISEHNELCTINVSNNSGHSVDSDSLLLKIGKDTYAITDKKDAIAAILSLGYSIDGTKNKLAPWFVPDDKTIKEIIRNGGRKKNLFKKIIKYIANAYGLF